MIGLIFRLISLALRLVSLALLVYCVMSFVMPQHEWYRKLARYIDPLLNPVRERLWRWFPSLRTLPVDLSPMALWLLLQVVSTVLQVLR